MTEEASTGGILVVGAHAGDAENMAAALVLKHTRAGFPATLLHLTLGEAGHPRMSPEDYAEQRKLEVAESARLMGAEAHWLPYPDGRLPVTDELKLHVCDLIRQKRPAVVLTHWKGSFHKDHVAAYDIVQDTIGGFGYRRARRVLKRGGVFVDAGPGLASVFVGPLLRATVGGKVVGTVAKGGRDALEFLAGLVAQGKFKPVIERRYALNDIVEAHRHAEAGHKKGNLVIDVAMVPASGHAAR